MVVLAEKVMLITGAGQPFGRAAALAFAAQGCRLALNELSPDHLEGIVTDARALGAETLGFGEDIVKGLPARFLVDQVLDAWERIDCLIYCTAALPAEPLALLDEWDWHRALDVNLTGAFLLLQAALPALEEAGGCAVFLGAAAGPGGAAGLSPAYAAGKIGLLSLARAAAAELKPTGVRVYAALAETSGVETAPPPFALSGSLEERFAQLAVALCRLEGVDLSGSWFGLGK